MIDGLVSLIEDAKTGELFPVESGRELTDEECRRMIPDGTLGAIMLNLYCALCGQGMTPNQAIIQVLRARLGLPRETESS